MKLYHYTDRHRAEQIRSSGLLPKPTPLYRGLMGLYLIRYSRPVVWLTENPISEVTSWTAMLVQTERPNLVGYVARVTVDIDASELLTYAELMTDDSPADDWLMNQFVAQIAGAGIEHWRVAEDAIPASAISAVEVLASETASETTWAALE